MNAPLKTREARLLIATTTGCLCLLIVVVGTMVGISNGSISVSLLGSAKGLGIGGGLVGLSSVIYSVIRIGLK